GGGCGAGFASRTGGDVPSGQQRVYHGDSLLQEYGEQRDACRELVEQRGNVAGECDVHGGECLGMATGEFFQSGGDHGEHLLRGLLPRERRPLECEDRKSTRLNSSHVETAYAVVRLKKTKRAVCVG